MGEAFHCWFESSPLSRKPDPRARLAPGYAQRRLQTELVPARVEQQLHRGGSVGRSCRIRERHYKTRWRLQGERWRSCADETQYSNSSKLSTPRRRSGSFSDWFLLPPRGCLPAPEPFGFFARRHRTPSI